MISEKDAGCWIDGHWGHYAPGRLISIALAYGLPDPDGMFTRTVEDYNDNYSEFIWDVAMDAEDWLKQKAPEGYRFGWYDGEFFLWSDEQWEEE